MEDFKKLERGVNAHRLMLWALTFLSILGFIIVFGQLNEIRRAGDDEIREAILGLKSENDRLRGELSSVHNRINMIPGVALHEMDLCLDNVEFGGDNEVGSFTDYLVPIGGVAVQAGTPVSEVMKRIERAIALSKKGGKHISSFVRDHDEVYLRNYALENITPKPKPTSKE